MVIAAECRVSAPQRYLGLRFVVLFLAALSLIDLLSMLVIVGLHAHSPPAVATGVLAPMSLILAAASSAAVVLALGHALLSYPAYRATILILTLIVLALLGTHLYTINAPDTANCYDNGKNESGCVMDEIYYVPAAQAMLSGEKCATYADVCNLEHPFLSKAFVAAGIAIFGNNTFGWRIFEVVLGTSSIPVLFGICWTMTRNARLSLFASFLLAFETLFFVQSGIAVIDVGAVFFGLLGFFFYFARVRWWKFGPTVLTAIAFGLAALSKETAIVLFLVLAVYHVLFGEGNWSQRYIWALSLAAGTFAVFAAGLQVYDSLFVVGSADWFGGQIEFIVRYGASLTMTTINQGWIDSVLHTPITPWNWITYYSPETYLRIIVTVTSASGNHTYVSVGYYGIADQLEVWLIYVWGAYTAYLWWKTKGMPARFSFDSDAREFKLARLALVWVLVVFLWYLGLFYFGRLTYPFYFISAVPALAMGAAYSLTRSWFPRSIAYIVLGGVILWFFIFYPDKSFLPVQLRVLIGR